MKTILQIAIGIACCSLADASMSIRVDLPKARPMGFETDRDRSIADEYVPLAEQLFPETLNRHKYRGTNARAALLEQLSRDQQQLRTAIERQRKLYEKIRQQKIREKIDATSPAKK